MYNKSWQSPHRWGAYDFFIHRRPLLMCVVVNLDCTYSTTVFISKPWKTCFVLIQQNKIGYDYLSNFESQVSLKFYFPSITLFMKFDDLYHVESWAGADSGTSRPMLQPVHPPHVPLKKIKKIKISKLFSKCNFFFFFLSLY